jgi:hypothetical protein
MRATGIEKEVEEEEEEEEEERLCKILQTELHIIQKQRKKVCSLYSLD